MENTEKGLRIKVRGGFSEKYRIEELPAALQLTEFDERTRVLISNKLFELLENIFEDDDYKYRYGYGDDGEHSFCKQILSEVFMRKTHLQYATSKFQWREVFIDFIDKAISEANYNNVLDLVWYICNWIKENYQAKTEYGYGYTEIGDEAYLLINDLFEREYVGYRFIGGIITPITCETEFAAVEDAIVVPFEGCRVHISKALQYLSDRENPDYKNSVKESISAVECLCKIITGKEHASLGDALIIMEKRRGLKGQLKEALTKLYSYTNDKGGIRHADGLFVSDVTFEEAKFMLVSCSAFVNYLIAEYGKIKGDK